MELDPGMVVGLFEHPLRTQRKAKLDPVLRTVKGQRINQNCCSSCCLPHQHHVQHRTEELGRCQGGQQGPSKAPRCHRRGFPHSGQEQPLPLTCGVGICPPSCSKLGETGDLCNRVTKVMLSRSCCCR